MVKEPDYLYRYISVDTLEAMLKYETVRFSALDEFDDLEEGKSKDATPIRRFVYASCWTDDSVERPHMWRMYTNLHDGVRVKMVKYPFDRVPVKNYSGVISGADNMDGTSGIQSFLKGIEELAGLPYTFSFQQDDNFLFKIEYTLDENKLFPKIIDIREDEGGFIEVGILGKYKNECWEDQKEWRYILTVWPFNIIEATQRGQVVLKEALRNMLNPEYVTPVELFTLNLSKEAIETMEITLSPQISTENKFKVYNLVRRYSSGIFIKESELTNKIKLKL